MTIPRGPRLTAASRKLQEGTPDFPSASTNSSISARSEFVAVLERSGLHDALGYLNGRARFRFTGLYRSEASVLVNESLYDRENPSLIQGGEIHQLRDTYCSIVLATRDVFVTDDSLVDPRLEQSQVRRTVISYCGVPIRTPNGRVAGVLCHYDLRPRLLPAGELVILTSVTPYLASRLQTSPP